MRLTVSERLMLMQMTPQKADIWVLKILDKFKTDLGFDEDELTDIGFVRDGEQVRWSAEAPEKDVHVGAKMQEIIGEALREMNRADPPMLTDAHKSLWDKFVGDLEEPPDWYLEEMKNGVVKEAVTT